MMKLRLSGSFINCTVYQLCMSIKEQLCRLSTVSFSDRVELSIDHLCPLSTVPLCRVSVVLVVAKRTVSYSECSYQQFYVGPDRVVVCDVFLSFLLVDLLLQSRMGKNTRSSQDVSASLAHPIV